MKKKSFWIWMSGSLVGHLVGCQLFYAMPMFLILFGLHLNDGGTATFIQVLQGLAIASLSGILGALLIWFAVTYHLKKNHGKLD